MADGMAPEVRVVATLGDVVTERLALSRLESDDLAEMAAVFGHPEVWEFPFGRAFSTAETQAFLDAQTAAWEERGFGLWSARCRGEGRLLGFVGLSVPTFLREILPAVEVGWRLIPSAWGFGYATEGATAALDQAFTTLGLDRVCSVPQAENARSLRVADRLGMKPIRPVTIAATDRRGEVHAILYEITRSEWQLERGHGPSDGDELR